MKKTLLSFMMLGCIGIYTSQAQITINSSNLIGVGDVVEQAKDTLPGSITIGPSGASQTWNFTTINEDVLDTLSFISTGAAMGASNFPASNMVFTTTEEGSDSSWVFMTKNTAGLFIDGFYQVQNGNGNAIPATNTIITFPSTMGTNFGGTANNLLGAFPVGQDLDGPGPQGTVDSLRITRQATVASNVDAWGNVTTPFGTFASIRQNISEETIDTTWQLVGGNWSVISSVSIAALVALGVNVTDIAYDTTRTARWWTDDANAMFVLVEMDYNANGSVNEVQWQKSTPTVGVSENAIANAGISLYPNPTNDVITITSKLKNNASVTIFDVTGKLISTTKFNSNSLTLSVSDFDNGVYFYNIYDVNGNVIHSNKFVVAK